jgi:amino acid adenylation domain-containing protein
MQQGMLFHGLEDAGSGLYVNQLSVEIGGLDAARLRSAWQSVSDRHAVLRTGMLWEGLPGAAQQVVHRRVAVPFVEEDWRGRPADATGLQAAAAAERAKGFDLSKPPLQRVRLIRLADDRHQLIWTHHHILLDGWAAARMVAEVLRHMHGAASPPASGQYRDHIAWLQRQDRAAAERFWRQHLAALPEPCLLAAAMPAPEAPAAGAERHASLAFALDEAETARLTGFARRERITLNTLIQGAWALLLQRHLRQRCIAFGTTVAGRPTDLPGAEDMLGLFINTLPVVAQPQPAMPVGDWLRALQAQNLAMREHEHAPLHEIQAWAGQAGQALFDSIIVFESYPVDALLRPAGGTLRIGSIAAVETSNYALFLMVAPGARLRLTFNHHRDRFAAASIENLHRHLRHLLAAMAEDAARPLGRVGMLGAPDRAALEVRNVTAMSCPPTDIASFLAAAALRHPERIALVAGRESLTYAALHRRADRLAWRLRRAGIGPEVPVGLAMERSAGMLVGLLAILKAGGAYVPLDPDYPPARLAQMMQDSGLALVLTQESLVGALPDCGATLLCIDGDGPEMEGAPPVVVGPENLAYLIYTSGSTGTPKGVMVRHGAVVNFLASMAQQPGIAPGDVVLGLTSLSFDIAVLELLLPLAAGARLVLADRAAARDPAALLALIRDQGVTMVQATPSSWRMLVEQGGLAGLPRGIRILAGGEALPADLAAALIGHAGAMWNLYGPTETTIWSARHRLDAADPRPALGLPIGNTMLHVLDDALNLLPPGAIGELHIGGAGLARGYRGRPGLTAERFIPDPHGASGDRLYRTGDLVRLRPDGGLDFLGRADHQVKIRGFRIEPGEIEAQLLAEPGVRDAVVVARPGAGGPLLLGYVAGSADPDALRKALAARLPDHMVPARIMVLDRLPLTPNGKIDRAALPRPDRPATRHVAPRNATEAALAAIWAELLALPEVGVTDSFFDLGGHSLLATQAVARIRQRLGQTVTLRAFFAARTIEALAALLEREAQSKLADADLAAMFDALDAMETSDGRG